MTTLSPDEARKLIIRSVTVQDADMDEVFQLPATTWIGGKVRQSFLLCYILHYSFVTFLVIVTLLCVVCTLSF